MPIQRILPMLSNCFTSVKHKTVLYCTTHTTWLVPLIHPRKITATNSKDNIRSTSVDGIQRRNGVQHHLHADRKLMVKSCTVHSFIHHVRDNSVHYQPVPAWLVDINPGSGRVTMCKKSQDILIIMDAESASSSLTHCHMDLNMWPKHYRTLGIISTPRL